MVETDDWIGRAIWVITFLGIFVFLTSTMPVQFYVQAPDYKERSIPDDWSISDIQLDESAFWGNSTVDYYPDYPVYHSDFEIERGELGNIWIDVCWGTKKQFEISRIWWIIYPFTLGWDWVQPFPLLESDVRKDMDESGNFTKINMHDSKYNYITYIFFNSTLYSNLTEALDDGHVIIKMGQGLADSDAYESVAWSGFDLIFRLLFFQMPDIHWTINAIIALPIWVCIGILSFVVIMKIIKALPFT